MTNSAAVSASDTAVFLPEQSQVTSDFRALGTRCQVILCTTDGDHGLAVARLVEQELKRIEAKFSRYREDSVTSAIRRAAGDPKGIFVDDETAAWLDYADVCYQQSDGLFDITSGILRKAWNFRDAVVPSQASIDQILPLIAWEKVRWQRPHLFLPMQGMELDFGGFGKEYAADLAAALCHQHGIHHGLIDLGGDLHVLGVQSNNLPWRVGVSDPREPGRAKLQLDLFHGGMATSGDYERFFVHEGVRYCHILNPRTGWPVQGLASVTVLAPKCLIAGTLTTIALLKGASGGVAWLHEMGLPYLTIDQQGVVSGTIGANAGEDQSASE